MVRLSYNAARREAVNRKALTDTGALLTAKLVENITGSRAAIEETMELLFQDPERLGSVTLSLMGMVSALANLQPGGLQAVVDHLIHLAGLDVPDPKDN